MKTLLGVGGSEDSIRALRHTVDRVKVTGDELTVVVLENPESELSPDEIESRVRGILADEDLSPEIRRVSGDPASSLIDIAEREGFDEIVLGGGQKSPMGKIKIGHIAEFVLLNSNTTVKLVR